MIKVVVAEVNKKPEVREIPNTLEALQQIVDGYIEVVPIKPNMTIICNEEGRLEGLPYNRHVGQIEFLGTIIGTADDGEGEFVSLTKKQIDFYMGLFD